MSSIGQILRAFDGSVPGAALMLIRDGKPVAAQAYGLANLRTGEPCTVDTNFRIASLTKAFTAMAVMILRERGSLSLDALLSNYFTEAPACACAISIRQLLTHTSGLLDYEDLIPPGTAQPLKDRDAAALVLRESGNRFAPGSQFRYSNTGYVLLALIVERVSKMSFAEFLRANIFAPLQMTNTVAYEQGISTVANRALGYTIHDGIAAETDQDLTSSTLGDGGVYSSVADLFKWDQALYTERLVSAATLRQMFTPWSPISDFDGSGYGFGWYVAGDCAWHYGSSCGFSARIERHPKRRMTLILLANRRDAGLGEAAREVIQENRLE